MAITADQLGKDEYVIATMRTHVKKLIIPVVFLFAIAIVLGVAIALFPAAWQPWATWIAVAAALIAFVVLVVRPALHWWSSTYTVTNRRIITRHGVLTRVGHDLPLRRINNVNYERGVVDRMVGCGTLIFETAAGQPLRLPDVPEVEKVHVQITELLFGDDEDD
ncbi:PH domain-containing protein [Tessaracoccus palaemonis]|uniref:PH domain-containing protein n=1 Tax=Tessaracoccus palaemonis TaxID=2829499 RepID=A0ABX8SK30_9ACTN|nr:PH domain-containing protein [Tessaracoccus palaemonis]QXT63683.1 PH domain-containing protein [Tessaracoccus palaemonis]